MSRKFHIQFRARDQNDFGDDIFFDDFRQRVRENDRNHFHNSDAH